METTASQAYIFMITLYGGILVGVAYDVYRGIRKAFRNGRWLTALLDTLFIITLGIIVVFVLYTANQGELRLYTFVGFVLGFALYMAGLSPFISYLAKKIKKKRTKVKNKLEK
ncbi:MAG: spore cortex biosynthesis protein YabQ [Eubacteriales bacterium]|nr:spore cortex biosynthesis protein YabQ [Eubacteriales bacterium]